MIFQIDLPRPSSKNGLMDVQAEHGQGHHQGFFAILSDSRAKVGFLRHVFPTLKIEIWNGNLHASNAAVDGLCCLPRAYLPN